MTQSRQDRVASCSTPASAQEAPIAAKRQELTADESAELKMRFKRDQVTAEIRLAASTHVAEASEAIEEVEQGLDRAEDGSWVAEVLA